MRAITGAVVSSKPCSLLSKAFRILKVFYQNNSSDLPSADCATYIRTTIEATREHELFRRGLRDNLPQGAANLEAHDYEGEINHQDREREGDMAVPTGGSQRDSAAEVEPDVAAGEKKSKKKKNKEDRPQDIAAAAGVESHIPSSAGIGSEKRKKEKHSKKEIVVQVKQEPDLVVDEELVSEKESKKKKEKGRVKLEDEAMDVNEVGGKFANGAGLEQNVAGGEKKRKKKKHEEKEVNFKDVKQEEKIVSDGGLDSEKKRKKKRGRGDNDDNALEQVEHIKKKQRK